MNNPAFQLNPQTARSYRQFAATRTRDVWKVKNEDPAAQMQAEFADWLKQIGTNEQLFKLHIYENPNAGKTDLRQLRGRLCQTIAWGEQLAVIFETLSLTDGTQKEGELVVSLIDQNLEKLFDTLFAWCGPISMQADVPESFKQASKEAREGNIVDLDI